MVDGWRVWAPFHLGIVQFKIKHIRILFTFIPIPFIIMYTYHSPQSVNCQYGLTWLMIIIRCNLPLIAQKYVMDTVSCTF